eukprot:gene2821-5544_t
MYLAFRILQRYSRATGSICSFRRKNIYASTILPRYFSFDKYIDDDEEEYHSPQYKEYKDSNTKNSNRSPRFGKIFHQLDMKQVKNNQVNEIFSKCSNNPNQFVKECIQLSKEGKTEIISLLFDRMEKSLIPINSDCKKAFLESCLISKDSKIALQFIRNLPSHQKNNKLFKVGLLTCAIAGDSTSAYEILQLMKDCNISINSGVWNAIIDSYANNGDVEGALQAFKDMNEKYGIEPSTSTYNRLIKACAIAKNFNQAKILFNELQQRDFIPDDSTWATYVQVALSENNFNEAKSIIEDMLKLSQNIPYQRVYNTLLMKYVEVEDISSLEVTLEEMKSLNIELDFFTYNILLTAYTKINNKIKIKEIISKMLSNKIILNYLSWRIAVAPYTRTLDIEGMISLIDIIREGRMRPTIEMWRDVIGLLGKLGKYKEAYEVIGIMFEKDSLLPNVQCWHRIVRCTAQYAGWREAYARIIEMRTYNGSSNGSNSSSGSNRKISGSNDNGGYGNTASSINGHIGAGRGRSGGVVGGGGGGGCHPIAPTWQYVLNACAQDETATIQDLLELLLTIKALEELKLLLQLQHQHQHQQLGQGQQYQQQQQQQYIEMNTTTYINIAKCYKNVKAYKSGIKFLEDVINSTSSLSSTSASLLLSNSSYEDSISLFNYLLELYIYDCDEKKITEFPSFLQKFNISPNVSTISLLMNAVLISLKDWDGLLHIIHKLLLLLVRNNNLHKHNNSDSDSNSTGFLSPSLSPLLSVDGYGYNDENDYNQISNSHTDSGRDNTVHGSDSNGQSDSDDRYRCQFQSQSQSLLYISVRALAADLPSTSLSLIESLSSLSLLSQSQEDSGNHEATGSSSVSDSRCADKGRADDALWAFDRIRRGRGKGKGSANVNRDSNSDSDSDSDSDVSINGSGVDVLCWRELIRALCVSGRVPEARDALQDMVIMDGHILTVDAWDHIFDKLKEGPYAYSECIECMDEVRNAGFKPKVEYWHAVITTAIREKKFQEALEAIENMRNLDDLLPTLPLYNIILKFLIRRDDVVGLVRILYLIKKDKIELDGDILKEFDSMKRFDLVLEELDKLPLLKVFTTTEDLKELNEGC